MGIERGDEAAELGAEPEEAVFAGEVVVEEAAGESRAAAQIAEIREAGGRFGEIEERWPAVEVSEQVDCSGEEPGSWRGEGGGYLSPSDNATVGEFCARLRGEVQPKVCADVEEAKDFVEGAALVGLEFQVKGEDRVKEKVAARLDAMPDERPEAAAGLVPDALRYTYQFSTRDYVDGYHAVCRNFEDRGFEMDSSWNSWGQEEYKGINTRWRTQEGQLFEVQFHTPESFEAKQATHGAYERLRNPLTSDEQIDELKAFQREISGLVPIPDGVGDVQDYKRRG
ncbi:hypothetical protein OIE66_10140 [Nonomuraea sp. NBC_01738]|uniref:hypothetical protein n=1 Tax=Nonomuraea sp. NBC_01738 TaxID=2976003 RepID=UPI002E0D1178|nr:hypothetical protein OIE66_10140 [Nonomuraea sp. NBC_01738]